MRDVASRADDRCGEFRSLRARCERGGAKRVPSGAFARREARRGADLLDEALGLADHDLAVAELEETAALEVLEHRVQRLARDADELRDDALRQVEVRSRMQP